ncbi:aminoglycoside phosphotransferase family protein [Chloroflexi bacterium TSY]|nr:aminoglycoside phosphotransferase family protein [Chloroflexi bacterium TSY]
MNQKITIPDKLRRSIGHHSDGPAWLAQLPTLIMELSQRWSLTLAAPFEAEASCSWVAPCTRADGSTAVFKIGKPHMEAEDEIAALRFWNGDPTAHLLEADETHNAMLLERCQPGTVLRTLPEEEQDRVLAKLLRRLWRTPPDPHLFRSLSEMVAFYNQDSLEQIDRNPDPALVRDGVDVYRELVDSTTEHVLLSTDLHAGNVLRAQREPWLVIDPKPFIGDPAYDATQHLLNCMERLHTDPIGTIDRFAGLLDVDAKRVRLWLFARLSTQTWGDLTTSQALARRLAL